MVPTPIFKLHWETYSKYILNDMTLVFKSAALRAHWASVFRARGIHEDLLDKWLAEDRGHQTEIEKHNGVRVGNRKNQIRYVCLFFAHPGFAPRAKPDAMRIGPRHGHASRNSELFSRKSLGKCGSVAVPMFSLR